MQLQSTARRFSGNVRGSNVTGPVAGLSDRQAAVRQQNAPAGAGAYSTEKRLTYLLLVSVVVVLVVVVPVF